MPHQPWSISKSRNKFNIDTQKRYKWCFLLMYLLSFFHTFCVMLDIHVSFSGGVFFPLFFSMPSLIWMSNFWSWKTDKKKPKLTGIPSSPDPPQESEKNTAAKPVGIPYTLERLLTQTSLASPMFLPPWSWIKSQHFGHTPIPTLIRNLDDKPFTCSF